MAITMAANLGLVPQRRLGALLAQRRELYGYTVADMARQSGGRFTESELEAIEHGVVTLDDVAIEALSLIYEFNSSPPTQSRSRLINADDEDLPQTLGGLDAFNDDLITSVLRRYVALLYLLRNKPVGDRLPLRGDDNAMLAAAFNESETAMAERLHHIMDHDDVLVGEQAERMRRRLIVPAAGLLVGPTPAGMLVLVK